MLGRKDIEERISHSSTVSIYRVHSLSSHPIPSHPIPTHPPPSSPIFKNRKWPVFILPSRLLCLPLFPSCQLVFPCLLVQCYCVLQRGGGRDGRGGRELRGGYEGKGGRKGEGGRKRGRGRNRTGLPSAEHQERAEMNIVILILVSV